MRYQRVMIMVLSCLMAICGSCTVTTEEVKVVEFEGGLVLEATVQKQASVTVIDASDRMVTATLEGMVMIESPDYLAMLMVDVRPATWTDEILLNFMKQEIALSMPQDSESLTISERSQLTAFSSGSSSGFYQTMKMVNASSNREFFVVVGGYLVENLWIHLTLSVPVTNSPPIEEYLAFPDSVLASHPVNDDFLQEGDLVPRRLNALKVQW